MHVTGPQAHHALKHGKQLCAREAGARRKGVDHCMQRHELRSAGGVAQHAGLAGSHRRLLLCAARWQPTALLAAGGGVLAALAAAVLPAALQWIVAPACAGAGL